MKKEDIINMVCEVYNITPGQMREKTKRRHITDSRKTAAYLLFDTGLCKSVREISKEIGLCRNSSYSVLVCFRELLKFDPAFRQKYLEVVRRLELDP